MNQNLENRLYSELKRIVLIDPHSHINPHSAPSKTIADVLGYHYYTELAHSAGMAKNKIEPDASASGNSSISPKEKVGRLMEHLGKINNTVQWSWMLDLSSELLGWNEPQIDLTNWERLYDLAENQFGRPNWEEEVLQKSNVEAIFLTNDFDDPLTGFNTKRYIPCLRTDDLVFHLHTPAVRTRLEKSTQLSVTNISTLKQAIAKLFEHFTRNGARACAISLPPSFTPAPVSDSVAEAALRKALGSGEITPELSQWIFWTLAEFCAEYKLPFDLMIGVVRKVYPTGVYQGQDLYDSRVSMIQYAALLNHFSTVTFPISVLASVTNQELVDYAWIFPNVVTNGHWWYSNTPSFIARDLSARLEAIPRTKQIGYYSDAYKLEFIAPKFNMYRKILAQVLAQDFAVARKWSEESCLDLGKQILRGNVEQIFSCAS